MEALEKLFLQSETEIINEIGRLRSQGLVDYHAVAALERVQRILQDMQDDAGIYVPKLVEKMFYVRVPEARKMLQIPETPQKHLSGYINAVRLTSTQTEIAKLLTANLLGQINQASTTAMATLTEAILGRQEADIFRSVGLYTTARMQATGRSVSASVPQFVATLQRQGVTAFVDRAGRKWSLHDYGNMVCRTTSRQAEVSAILTADEKHDLYQISRHGTTCGLCAPFEGRVYSKSGNDPDFPPLADAFGKIDPFGGNILTNTYLNLHPNCLHSIVPWTPMGRSEEEIQKIKDFSSPALNPYSVDPRSQKQIDAYRKKEVARRHWLADYKQWERYRITLGKQVPSSFAAFQSQKRAGSAKYQQWQAAYRKAKKEVDMDDLLGDA